MNYTTFAPIVVPGASVVLLVAIILTVYFKNNRSLESLKPVGSSILHWTWVKGFLYWLIMSAGTVAECAFLIASLWMSLNSSIHHFIRIFLSEDATIHVSELATAAYVGLPECILFLASVTVIGRVRLWRYDRQNKIALVWGILYGLPTLVFLILSLFTLGSSVLSVQFQMPNYLIVARALAGYVFGFIAFLDWRLGVPQEVDRLKQKDAIAEELAEQNRVLSEQIEALKAEMASHNHLLDEQKTANKRLIDELQKTDDDALQAYGDVCLTWLKSGVKSASVEDISHYTGHSKRKISGANLARSPRNPELILISALVSWLKMTPPPTHKAEDKPTDNILYYQPQEAVNVS